MTHVPGDMTHATWPIQHGPYNMAHATRTIQHGPYNMTQATWPKQHDPSNMTQMTWFTKHDPFSLAQATWPKCPRGGEEAYCNECQGASAYSPVKVILRREAPGWNAFVFDPFGKAASASSANGQFFMLSLLQYQLTERGQDNIISDGASVMS